MRPSFRRNHAVSLGERTRLACFPSRLGEDFVKLTFLTKGEDKNSGTSVWRDAQHQTRDACASLFNRIIKAGVRGKDAS